MNTPRFALLGLVPLLVLACSKNDASSASAADAQVAVPSASSAAVSPSSSPSGQASAKGRDAGATALTAQQRAVVLRELKEGRRLSRAKDWAGAIKAFDRALAIAPDDARVLSEVGWAAFQANDLARAESANKRALANAKEPEIRAPILYNMGRVAEAKGQNDVAKKAYGESLALRDNAEVKKRLTSIGGTPPSTETGLDAAAGLHCKEGAPSIEALCTCLAKHDDELMTLVGEKSTCKKMPSAPILHARLSVMEWGTDGGGERVHLLVLREGDKYRPVAELGRDYEPGAFGVHNNAEVKGGEVKKVHGHDVVVVKSEQNFSDSNLAGIEMCIENQKLETVCALSDAAGATKCTQIAVDVESGCTLGVEPEPGDVDEETRKTVEALKKAKTTRSKASWAIAEDGKLTVQVVSGPRDGIPARMLRPFALW